MLAASIRCVVGIDVAKAAHVVCALAAPSGTVLRKSTPIAASAQGYGQLRAWLHDWDGGGASERAAWAGVDG